MCSIAEDSHIQCEIPGFSHRNWKNVDYGVKFQEHFKKNNKDMSFDFSIAKKIANNQMYSIVWEKKSQKMLQKIKVMHSSLTVFISCFCCVL
jgi:hypothetical protein